jgi:chemotaxis response regulator CheB
MVIMTRKRILLIESGQFLGGVIRSLFTSCEQFDVITASPANWRKLLAVARESQPDIIVMDDTLGSEYLTNLLLYMQNSQVLRIIIVNTESNQVQLYQKEEIVVQQSKDLFAMLGRSGE